MEALYTIHELIDSWIFQKVGTRLNTFLRTFGSFRLINNFTTDIDCILITPQTVPREMIFSDEFCAFLKSVNCTNVRMIPKAYVPLIKFHFDQYDFDLLHAPLPYEDISIFDNKNGTDILAYDNNLLRMIDSKTYLSLNGLRTTEKIMHLVPNLQRYLDVLMIIKKWAKCRDIYSNIMGYWGGISWNIAAAKVCQMYDSNSETIERLVYLFFLVMDEWDWKCPIMIAPIEDYHYNPSLEPWNPNHTQNECMPVLTPAFPSKNSAYNVLRSTFYRMKQEFHHARLLCKECAEKGQNLYDVLYTPSTFLTDYPDYLQITATANDDDMEIWKSYIESKLKILVKTLEMNHQINATPYARSIDNMFYIGLNKKRDEAKEENKEDDNKEDNKNDEPIVMTATITGFTNFIKQNIDSPYKDGMSIEFKLIKNA